MRNNEKNITSINIMRLICAYMVVAIHIRPLQEYGLNYDYLFNQILCRVAVPFFFITSGYFFFTTIIDNQSKFKQYLKRLILTYSVWSIIYIIIQILQNHKFPIKSILLNYFIYGTEYHLWYFPALIYCILITSLFYKYKKIKILSIMSIILYFVGLLGCSYYDIGTRITILNPLFIHPQFIYIRRIFLMGLPFFIGGYFSIYLVKFMYKFKKNHYLLILILLDISFVGEILFVNHFRLSDNIIITLFLYPLTIFLFLLCLKYPSNKFSKYNLVAKNIANFTYYSHPLFMLFTDAIFQKILGIVLQPTLKYVLVLLLTTITALVLKKFNIKILIS